MAIVDPSRGTSLRTFLGAIDSPAFAALVAEPAWMTALSGPDPKEGPIDDVACFQTSAASQACQAETEDCGVGGSGTRPISEGTTWYADGRDPATRDHLGRSWNRATPSSCGSRRGGIEHRSRLGAGSAGASKRCTLGAWRIDWNDRSPARLAQLNKSLRFVGACGRLHSLHHPGPGD